MYVAALYEQKTGRTLLNYYEAKRINGKVKQIFVERIGYVDEFTDRYADPKAHFKAIAKERTASRKARIELDMEECFPFSSPYVASQGDSDTLEAEDLVLLYGMLPLSRIYHELEIGYFMDNRRRSRDVGYNLNHVFQLLVYGRILFPDSKLGTWQQRNRLLGDMAFSDDDVYRSLAFFADQKQDLIAHLDRMVTKRYGREELPVFYDVTNYYWEIDGEDGAEPETDGEKPFLRKRGCSKEHRPEPIVQMGLMMDSEGLPMDFDLFDGNTNDSLTFSPMMGSLAEHLGRERVIYVADKGMMSGDNRAEILVNHNGYVLSCSLRNASRETKAYVLSEDGYRWNGDGSYAHKSRLVPVEIAVTDRSSGRKRKVRINERQIVFWSRKYRDRSRHERLQALEKAVKYGTAENRHGANRYLRKDVVDRRTGEVIEDKEYLKTLDADLLAQDEELDGYYLICTNVVGLDPGQRSLKGNCRFLERENLFQLNREVSDQDIIDMYRQLWQIEESFRIIKSELKARPVFVHKQDSIAAHFLVCFVALLLIRILQKKKLDNTVEVGRMLESLRKAKLVDVGKDIYVSSYCDNILERLGNCMNLPLTRKRYRAPELRKLLAKTRKVD